MGFWDIFKRGRDPDVSLDLSGLEDSYWKLYLKGLAIDKSAEFLARAIASSTFYHLKDGIRQNSAWSRLLNSLPNLDDSGPQFWQRVIYRLLIKNEVLIILSDDNQLLIADSYIRRTYALYEDRFERVVVKGYSFNRVFKRGDVIFLQYNNNCLLNYINGLYGDYDKLYTKLVEAVGRVNQIRATVGVRANGRFDDEMVKKLQAYADNLFKSFQTKSVAIVPTTNSMEYQELTNAKSTGHLSVEEIKRLRRQFDDEVAELVGIPVALLHGEMADLSSSQQIFHQYCVRPLNRKISAELTARLFGQVKPNEEIQVIGFDQPNIFDLANSIDKLIASGAFNRNEVSKELNYEPIAGGDVFVMTKNYQEEIEKGDENDNYSD